MRNSNSCNHSWCQTPSKPSASPPETTTRTSVKSTWQTVWFKQTANKDWTLPKPTLLQVNNSQIITIKMLEFSMTHWLRRSLICPYLYKIQLKFPKFKPKMVAVSPCLLKISNSKNIMISRLEILLWNNTKPIRLWRSMVSRTICLFKTQIRKIS